MLKNKILRWFGLMTINRAREICRAVHVEYERWIAQEFETDIGGKMKPVNALKADAADFADDSFNKVLEYDPPIVRFVFGKDAGDV